MDDTKPDQSQIDASMSRQQIAELTSAYCRGLDRADPALLKSIFHDDSTVVSGAFNGNGHMFAEEICRIVKAVFNRTFHSVASQRLDVDGDEATGETYVIAVASMADEDGAPTEMLTGGRYMDRFERRDGVWKFTERSFVCDWSIQQASTHQDDGICTDPQLRGQHGPEDPVHQIWH